VPQVDMTPEARSQYLEPPSDIANRFDELLAFLEINPHRLPPWCEVKSIGRKGGREVFRARVGAYRATYVFDGSVLRFTRFRLRKDIGYSALPKL
jgi:mRNA-degrading endonuclease RelE of RelBE toxin-antitoxin system